MHLHGWKQWKTLENYQKSSFFIIHMRNSKTRRIFFLAFRSDSQTLVDTQRMVAPQQFWVNLVIFVCEPLVSMIKKHWFYLMFLHEPYVSLSCVWWKKYFLIVFKHFFHCFRPWASRHLLFKIHNNYLIKRSWADMSSLPATVFYREICQHLRKLNFSTWPK